MGRICSVFHDNTGPCQLEVTVHDILCIDIVTHGHTEAAEHMILAVAVCVLSTIEENLYRVVIGHSIRFRLQFRQNS